MESYFDRAQELLSSVKGNYEHSTNIQDEELVKWLIEQAQKNQVYKVIVADVLDTMTGYEKFKYAEELEEIVKG